MDTTITASLGHNEQLQVSKTYTKINTPPYDCFGGNTQMMSTSMKPFPDLYKVFAKLSKSAHWMWWALVEKRNYTNNESFFAAADNLEAKRITKAYTELYKLDLIKRIKNQRYLINPKAVFPLFQYFPAVCLTWGSLE